MRNYPEILGGEGATHQYYCGAPSKSNSNQKQGLTMRRSNRTAKWVSVLLISVFVLSMPQFLATSTDYTRREDPISANNLTRVDESIIATNNLTYALNNACMQAGGFPGRGSDIGNTWYAAKLTKIFEDSWSPEDILAVKDFIIHHQKSDGGISFEEDANGTVVETWQALETLYLVGLPFDDLNLVALHQFLNSCVINETFFANDKRNNDTTLEVNYAGLRSASLLGKNLVDIGLNATLFYDSILNFYNNQVSSSNFGLFDENTPQIYASTYYALQCLNLTGNLEKNCSYSPEVKILTVQGEVLEGDNDSIASIDGNRLTIREVGNEINLSCAISLENRLDLELDFINLTLLLNNSMGNMDQNASFSLFNVSSGQWVTLTAPLGLDAPEEESGLFYLSTGLIRVSDFVNESLFEMDRALEAQIYFKNSSTFNLSLNFLTANFTVFNKSITAVITNATFDTIGACFDDNYVSENFFAINVLQFLDFSTNIWADYSTDIREFVGLFDVGNFLFVQQWLVNPSYIDVDLQSTFYSNYILDVIGELNSTINASSLQFMNQWRMWDGGFGGPSSLSLEATYYYVRFLADVNALTPSIKTTVQNFVYSYQFPSAYSGYAFIDDFTQTDICADTFFALKIIEILDNIQHVPHLQDIGNYFVDNQNTEGYFFSTGRVSDIYYSLQVISMINLALLINDVSLVDYIVNLQQLSGGFLSNQYDTMARVDSTCLILEIAKEMNILENIRVATDTLPGALDFLKSYQNFTSGGISEVTAYSWYINATSVANIDPSFLTLNALTTITQIKSINAENLLAYFLSLIPYTNNFALLTDPDVEKNSFATGLLNRVKVYLSLRTLDLWKLQTSIILDSRTAIRNGHAQYIVNVTSPYGDLLEGAEVVFYHPSLGLGVTSKDHQNGTYSGELASYLTTGEFEIIMFCAHPDYLGFNQTFNLKIDDVFSEDALDLQYPEQLWIDTTGDISITLVNDSSGIIVTDCSVTLLDETGGLVATLVDSDLDGTYDFQVAFPDLFIGTRQFTLVVQRDGFRSESYQITITVYPLWFLILLVGIGAVVTILIGFAIVRRQQIRIAIRKYLAKRKGQIIGFKQLENKSPPGSGKSAQKPSDDSTKQDKEKKGGVDYA